MIKTLADALAAKGYTTMTPVQEAVTDPELSDRDLLVSAQTGSGKTVGFGLAIAPTLLGDAEVFEKASVPLALVIAPTRELALQVRRELEWLYALTGAVVASCVGGMDMRTERRTLERGAHIVVGTPGRLRDHLSRNSLDPSELRAVVLDEADEMLDLGFRDDLEFILGTAPASRRTLLFSATVPRSIAQLAQSYQKSDAERIVTTAGAGQHSDIDYRAIQAPGNDPEAAIINLLRFHEAPTAMVFCNTRAAVNRLTARFANRGFSVVALSGELSQTERTHALQAMRDGRARICVATDVAARGIDLPNLDLVIHADMPTSSEALLHRSGRTGRAGRQGISALIVPGRARGKAERLLRFAKITATWDTPPTADDVLRKDEDRLLGDDVWTSDVKPEDAAFLTRMQETYTPEQIAAACLNLYRAGRSAPEDLAAPEAPRAPRQGFENSVWFQLSIGRDKRAEPRWLLPMLCRSGNIDKSAIGAIRVQQTLTFLELQSTAVDGFMTSLGPKSELEDGITVTKMDKAPDLSAPRPREERGPRPAYNKDRKGPRRDNRNDDRPPRPRHDGPRNSGPKSHSAPADVAPPPHADKPAHSGKTAYAGKPSGGAKHGGAAKKPFERKDAKPGKPASKKPDSPRKAGASDPSARMGKPRKPGAGKFAGSEGGKKPRHKAGGKGGESAPKRR